MPDTYIEHSWMDLPDPECYCPVCKLPLAKHWRGRPCLTDEVAPLQAA